MEASADYHTIFLESWLKEYLPTLTKRVKWHVDDKSVKVGDLVLL